VKTRAYRQSKLYKASAWLLVLGRVGVIATLPVFALLFWSPRSGRSVHPPGWWLVTIISLGSVTFAALWASVVLAVLMKCDECGHRPTIVWSLRGRRRRTRNEWQALKDDFYPQELRSGRFQCEHCGTQFRLLAC
jgi:hypothetical protein